jgi:glycosyltransferase A (GT-A) superfamily protein (DUF2064 family)
MKSNSSVYLFTNSAKFNKEFIPDFESFSKDDSFLLYSSLVLNHREIFEQLPKTVNLISCFDDNDKEFLPEEFKGNNIQIIFGDTTDKKSLLKRMSHKFFNESTNNLIILSDSIGITCEDIQKAFNLLQIDDEVIVLGKTNNDKVAFIGFNSFNKELFYDIEWDNLTYDYLLAKVNKHENLIHVLGNYMLINSIVDFKNLYAELSRKESLAYCSQNMHERFTNLFIEYKELLK